MMPDFQQKQLMQMIHDREEKPEARLNAAIIMIEALLEQVEICPFDCDPCHGDNCPCDRVGCEGYEPQVIE